MSQHINLHKLSYKLFSGICILCRGKSHRDCDLCEACEKDLPQITHACRGCARELAAPTDAYCGNCLKYPPPYQQCHIPFSYEYPLKKLILDFKFHHKLASGQVLATLLSQFIESQYKSQKLPELLIPVPLHKKRLQQRGFNQAVELVRLLKKQLNITLDTKSCQRLKNTSAQIQLPMKQRKKNIRQAFQCKPLQAKHIALIDDVFTTGSTIKELTTCVLQAGATQIDVWCLARA